MNEYLKQMVASGKADIETYPLAQMQRQVNKVLNLRRLSLLTDTIIYQPKPRYWIETIEESDN